MGAPFNFAGHAFQIVGEAALYWPAQKALLVADLHLEKASAYAATGQMLPPYDSQATLDELANLLSRNDVAAIYALGDNYHDSGGELRLTPKAAEQLQALTSLYDWHWIVGNHDPDLSALWGGHIVPETQVAGITLRHQADPNDTAPEMSGHFHPKYRQSIRGRMVSRRCFVKSAAKLIFPAFGALTGGLDADDAAIFKAMGYAQREALVAASGRVLHLPLVSGTRAK